MDRTTDLLGLCDVHRWTVIKTNRNQSVAEHSFSVAVIAMELMDVLPVREHIQGVLVWALCHDAPETLTGDIDGKFKRDFPGVQQAVREAEGVAFPWYKTMAAIIPGNAKLIVKVADYIEAISFIQRWGVGPRADAVGRQLRVNMVPYVNQLAYILGRPEDEVTKAVMTTLNCSVEESGCIQFRSR